MTLLNLIEGRATDVMDYYNDVLTTFLGLERVSCVAVYAGSESSLISHKNILICVLKMNKYLTALERHEGG